MAFDWIAQIIICIASCDQFDTRSKQKNYLTLNSSVNGRDNIKKHNRRSIRLPGYDYSGNGFYFITICVQNRAHLFGQITNVGLDPCPVHEMVLNDAGKMVARWYYELEMKFHDIRCHEMVVMPDHFHCIIENVGADGADLRVCPEIILCNAKPGENVAPSGEHAGSPLRRVVQWFKTMTTNEYIRGVKNLGWTPFNGKLWQRNYYEHIIRNETSRQIISNYIANNPANWNKK